MIEGGRSLERAVSLSSGARVEDALATLGHAAVVLDAGADLVSRLQSTRPDVAFVALHGPGGEDGTVQELLEILEIPYTGPGVAGCMRSIDKVVTKHLLREAGLPTPDWVAFNATAFRELGAADALDQIAAGLGFPLVIKPAGQGSALGVRFAAGAEEVPAALLAAFSYDERVLFERHVDGRELAVSLIDGEPLPTVEVIATDADRFNYEARYEIGRTSYVCPAELPAGQADAVAELARQCWRTLRLEGFARVDIMLGADGPEAIEANAIPGLTDTSLLPMAAEAAGLDFAAFVARSLELALARAATRRPGAAGLRG